MIRTILGGLLLLMFSACSKNKVERPGSTSLIIFHAVPDANAMRTSFSKTPPARFLSASAVVYAQFFPNSNMYHPIPGNIPLRLYNQPDTFPKSTPLFDLDLNLPEGAIHSLFLTGSVASPESVLVRDELQDFPVGDSAMGIRFVNLIPDNIPVQVNLLSQPNGSEVNELPYKGATGFKRYPVKMDVADYVFEFRNATTGVVIASYKTEKIANDGQLIPNAWIYKNFALALVGKLNGTGAQAPKVVRIPYSRNS